MIRKTLDQHIEVSPGICSGQPRVAGHRITVRQIVVWHDRMGQSVDEIATQHGLTISDVYAALAFYFDHREDVDAAAEADAKLVSELRLSMVSKLEAKRTDSPHDA